MQNTLTPQSPVSEVIQAINLTFRGWPDKWHTWENVKEAHRQLVDRFIGTLQVPDNLGYGSGIVTAGGGLKFFPSLWVLINRLRDVGCTQPIEVFYKGEAEMDPYMVRLLEELGAKCIDLVKLQKFIPSRILGGWEIKPYAMLHSSFRRVLYIDADTIPLKSPSSLFHTSQFQECGAVFWPDYPTWTLHDEQWKTIGLPNPAPQYHQVPPEAVEQWFSKPIPAGYPTPIESGMVLFDKSKCWKEMRLAHWYCEHAEFYFRHYHGDKEAYRTAWMKFGTKYAMPSRFPGWQTHTIYQYDFADEIILAHRCMDKWNLDLTQNNNDPTALGNDYGFTQIKKLQRLWDGKMWQNNHPTNREVEFVKALAGKYYYSFPAFPKYARMLELKRDGTIGEGSAAYEQSWSVFEQNSLPLLVIRDKDNNPTMLLTPGVDNILRGNWLVQQKPAIVLTRR